MAGSWIPLWFGNQDDPDEENHVYGTAKVLLALKSLNRADQAGGVKAQKALLALQNLDGGWGGGMHYLDPQESVERSSVEETALALEALIPIANTGGEDFRSAGPGLAARRDRGETASAAQSDRFLLRQALVL